MSAPLSPLEILDKLISFPTVSRDSNLPLVAWVEGYLESHGIETHRYTDPDQPKAAIFAHVGPIVEGAVVLSGHTDVVPVDGQAWQSDPFKLVERDGKYFGRGTCDMKGFDALAIWALVEAQRRGVSRPIQLALSFDEEIGCTGAPPLIEAMAGVVPKGSAVIVGEPSNLRPVTAHKGGYRFDTHVHGFEVHSSLVDRGVSAIMYGAKLIEWANQRNAENLAGSKTEVASLFDPPYTTCHIGMIAGGTANNITAKDCTFAMEFRTVPGESGAHWEALYRAEAERVQAMMQAVVPETSIEITAHFGVPGLKPETDGAAESLVRQVTGDNADHVVSYGTEAGHFQAAGYSAVVCGPGSIEQAHQPDEFITKSDFEAGKDFMERLLALCAA